MNVTFLIGNGFDLGLGLLTSFSDFILVYKEFSDKKTGKNELNVARRKLIKDMLKKPEEWSYFEKELGKYTVNFSGKKELFFDLKKDFEVEFVKYLKSEESKAELKPEIIKPLFNKELRSFYKEPNLSLEESELIQNLYRRTSSYKFDFIDFNYTKVLDRCIEIVLKAPSNFVSALNISSGGKNKIGEVVHVHGSVDDRFILGVDNLSQIENEEFKEDKDFLDHFVKPQTDKRIKMKYSERTKKIIDASNVICVYGMSIGETDETWWKYIAKWLAKDDSNYLIMFMYDKDYDNSISDIVIEKEDEYKHKFLKASESSVKDCVRISDRIYVAVNKNIFEMKLVSN